MKNNLKYRPYTKEDENAKREVLKRYPEYRYYFNWASQVPEHWDDIKRADKDDLQIVRVLTEMMVHMLKLGPTNKDMLKLIYDSPRCMGSMLLLQKLVGNPDKICAIIGKHNVDYFYIEDVNNVIELWEAAPEATRTWLRERLPHMLHKKPHDWSLLLKDTLKMLLDCGWEGAESYKNDMEALHDFLAREHTKRTVEEQLSRRLILKEVFHKRTCGRYDMEIPLSNHDVVNWGRTLANCVSTYWDSHEKGQCILVKVSDGVSYWVAELDNGKNIRQFKGKRNEDAPKEVQASFIEYVHNIKDKEYDKLWH